MNTKVNSLSDNLKVSATTQFSWNNTYFRYLIMRIKNPALVWNGTVSAQFFPSPQFYSKAMHDYQSKDYHLLLKLTENMTSIILKKNRVILTCT